MASETAPLAAQPDVQGFLATLGLTRVAGTLVIADLELARSAYVHPSNVPAASVAYTVADSTFGRGRFPRLTLLDLVERRSRMDRAAIRALAACGGVRILPPWEQFETSFGPIVWDVVERYELDGLFAEAPSYTPRPSHRALRPRGFDWGSPSQPEIPGALMQWRRLYKSLPRVRQIMAATVLVLYKGSTTPLWLKNVPRSLLAADAIEALRREDALRGWAELMALYPGW